MSCVSAIKKSLLIALFVLSSSLLCRAQINSYLSAGSFNTPQNQAFIETSLTLVGNSLASKEINGGFQNAANVSVKIYSSTDTLLTKRYNVIGPAFTNSLNAPSFIDIQRYPLQNGFYTIQVIVTDNYHDLKKSVVHYQKIKVKFNSDQLCTSSIQIVESYSKSQKQSALSKSGLDLVPYTVNYFPESINHLIFYVETYHADTVLGKDQSFVYSYYIENSQNLKKLENFGGFKKEKSKNVNPLLAKIDISQLETGNYNLVVELKDQNNLMQQQTKYYFQRLNTAREIKKTEFASIEKQLELKTIDEFFGACNNADTLKMFVECLWPIANGIDKERIINQSLKKDVDLMKKFAIDFWQRRAGDTANPVKLWGSYYKSVQEVMALFRCGKQKGYNSDRGRVYLQYGKPNQRSIQNYEANAFPYEIWQYYRTADESTGKFYSNKKFVFVNRAMGDDCHILIHSDMPGEFNNPRWQYELNRRNNDGKANLENETPAGSEFNQFNEIYSNPR